MEFKHKLAKASFDFVLSENKYPLSACGYLQEVFESGAEWLQYQPIADRLTEEEREKIIAMYNQAVGDTKGYYSDTWDAAYAVIEFCEKIFGKEMFENKE